MTNKGWWVSVPVSMKLSGGTIEWPKTTSRGVKTACSITSNNSSIDFDCSLQKTATGNGNLQPEIEINEYSSSNKLLEQFTTRVVLEYSRQP